MAQLSQDLVQSFLRQIDQGHQPSYTLNEFRQLCHFWLNNCGAQQVKSLKDFHEVVDKL